MVAGRKPAPQDGGAGGLVYSRFNHPNTEIVEDRLALLDGAESALLTASGMAAIGALFLTLTRPGDAVVHYTPLYGGTETLLTKIMTTWGVKSISFTNGLSEAALIDALEKAARRGPVKMLYLETPANPTNAIIDLAMTRQVIDQWSQTTVSGRNCLRQHHAGAGFPKTHRTWHRYLHLLADQICRWSQRLDCRWHNRISRALKAHSPNPQRLWFST